LTPDFIKGDCNELTFITVREGGLMEINFGRLRQLIEKYAKPIKLAGT